MNIEQERREDEEASKRDLYRTLDRIEVVNWLLALGKWDAFFTGTFRKSIGGDVAGLAFRRWVRKALPGYRAAFVVEQHPGGHGAHVHALLETRGAWRKGLWESWFSRHGRAHCVPIKGARGVAGYCTKVLGLEMTKQFRRGAFLEFVNVGPVGPRDEVEVANDRVQSRQEISARLARNARRAVRRAEKERTAKPKRGPLEGQHTLDLVA